MRANIIRQRLAERQPVINAWLSIASAYSAEGTGHSGFHSVTVDLQHGMIGFSQAVTMLQAISATPATPLVRVGELNDAQIMKLLDAGAYGVICPMISTSAQAKQLVSACRYPPNGSRSFGPSRGLLYGGPDYVAQADLAVMAMPMIETAEAVENIDSILAVDGIDMLYVGPNDLAFSIDGNTKPHQQRTETAIALVLKRAKAAGIPVGIFCASADEADDRLAQGFNLVTPGNDFGTLMKTNRANVAQLLDKSEFESERQASGGYG
jgi:4-hydroxy-2-oxoheptanedioate aldolase